MGFGDPVVKAYSGRPVLRNGTITVAAGWTEINICTVLSVSEDAAVLGAFSIWNTQAGTDAAGDALVPLPIIRLAVEATDQDARSVTIAPDRDVKGVTFHPSEHVHSVWIKAVGADCTYEYVAEYEVTPR